MSGAGAGHSVLVVYFITKNGGLMIWVYLKDLIDHL